MLPTPNTIIIFGRKKIFPHFFENDQCTNTFGTHCIFMLSDSLYSTFMQQMIPHHSFLMSRNCAIPICHQPMGVMELYKRAPATHQKTNCAKLPAKTRLMYFCSSTKLFPWNRISPITFITQSCGQQQGYLDTPSIIHTDKYHLSYYSL